MDIVKKNLFSIILAVVALAAVVANFYPMGGKYEDLHTQAQARAGVDSSLKGLMSKQRTVPVFKEGSEPQPLGHFPTPKIIEEGKKAAEQVAKGSLDLLDGVVKLNIHQPLVPHSLPGSFGDTVSSGEFARQYVRETGIFNPDTRGQSIAGRLKLGIPPSEAELTREAEMKKQEITDQTKRINAQGQIVNEQEIAANVSAALNGLAEQMRSDVAKNSIVYINPDVLTVLQNVGVVGTPPEPSTIWWAQVGLWVQQDIAQAIVEINNEPRSDGSKPANVIEAPVKRLLKMTIPAAYLGIVPLQPGQGAAPVDPNAPVAPTMDPNAKLTPNFAFNPTGRVNNGLFDVMQFDIDMDVEADAVPMVLERLCRGRLLSVVQVSAITSVDSALSQSLGYFYGNKPVVNVKCRCEELFMRKWTKDLMPPPVRKQLGVPEDQPATPAAPAAPAPGGT